MYARIILVAFAFLFGSVTAHAQKKNGKVSIPIEKGGVEKGKIKNGHREGTWKTYNANGDLIQTENYISGKRDGTYWRKDDSVVTTGSYTYNQKNGTFVTKVNGRVTGEMNYRFDTLDGKYFLETKDKKISGAYDRGKKTGLRVTDSTDYSGYRVKDSTNYKNGLRDGRSVIYRNGKKFSETMWWQGKRNGSYREYDPVTGKMSEDGNYTDDRKDGMWREYKDGRLSRVSDYEKGIHAANSISYGRDTTVITAVESYYPNGELKVLVRNDENGKLFSRWYYNDQANLDSAISFYPNGRRKNAQYTSYTNEQGMTQFYVYDSWYANGKLESHGYKHRQNKTGTWLMYDSTGRLQTSIVYQDNLPFGWFVAYHPNGKVKLKAYCYESITDTILVYDKNGMRVQQNNPAYSQTISEVQAQYKEIQFRDPNKFPADHKRKGIVALGPDANEGKWADEDAAFPGGNDSLNAFIKRTIRFPEPERRLSKEGEVHIKFLVEKDGTLSDIQIVRTVAGAPGFTKESMRLMRVMPNWKPAKTNGKVVRVYYILPISFTLQ